MKLELKYLATYLPYGLKVYHEDHIAIITEFYLPAGNHNPDLWVVSMKDSSNNELSCSVNFKEVKPILRPLSELTKEIEHNEEKFSPLLKMANKLYDKEPESFDSLASCIKWVDFMIIQVIRNKKGYDNIPHWAFNDLIKWHFDVFKLIDQDLAIDINTL